MEKTSSKDTFNFITQFNNAKKFWEKSKINDTTIEVPDINSMEMDIIENNITTGEFEVVATITDDNCTAIKTPPELNSTEKSANKAELYDSFNFNNDTSNQDLVFTNFGTYIFSSVSIHIYSIPSFNI